MPHATRTRNGTGNVSLVIDDGPRIVTTIVLVLGAIVVYVVGSGISNGLRRVKRHKNEPRKTDGDK